MSVNYAIDRRYGGYWYLASSGASDYCWTCNYVNCEATFFINQDAAINAHVWEMHAGVAPEGPIAPTNSGIMSSPLQLSQMQQPPQQGMALNSPPQQQELPSFAFREDAAAHAPVGQYWSPPLGNSTFASSPYPSVRHSPSADAAARLEERRVSSPHPAPASTQLQIPTSEDDRYLRRLAEARAGVGTRSVRQPNKERMWVWDAQLGHRMEGIRGEMRWVCHLCADGNDRKASQDGVQRHLREYHEVLTTVRVPSQGT